MADNMLQIIRQEEIERRYNKKHIDGYIRQAIEGNPDMVERMAKGVEFIEAYMAKSYYASKNVRISHLKGLDLNELILEIFVGIAYFQREELFTSVSAQLAGRLGFSDKKDAITTLAELLALLCETDAFDVYKPSPMASLVVKSCIPLEQKLLEFIDNSAYLPPMVCEPLELTHNRSSGYLSHTDSLILKGYNYHEGDLCIDVLNTLNKVKMRLDTDFVGSVEEDPNKEYTVERAKDKAAEKGKFITDGQALQAVAKQKEQWLVHKKQAYEHYLLMATNGNEFYFTHKVDKRGRIYSQGYYLSTQGTAHKKAMLELFNEELVDGVPE